MPAEVPLLSTVRGDRFTFDLTLWSDVDKTVPFSVEDADELKAELRLGTGKPVLAMFELTVTDAHVIRFVLPAEVSAQLSYGKTLLWDLQVTWGTSSPLDVRTLAKGKLLIEGDITDSDPLV